MAEETLFQRLQRAKGKGELYAWDDIIPHSWNHYKQQYVAIIRGDHEKFGLDREFISVKHNFTSSGANADLEAEEPTEEGTLVETKKGSHKHMYKCIYRREKGGWRLIAMRESYSGYFGGANKGGYKIYDGEEPRKAGVDEEKMNKIWRDL